MPWSATDPPGETKPGLLVDFRYTSQAIQPFVHRALCLHLTPWPSIPRFLVSVNELRNGGYSPHFDRQYSRSVWPHLVFAAESALIYDTFFRRSPARGSHLGSLSPPRFSGISILYAILLLKGRASVPWRREQDKRNSCSGLQEGGRNRLTRQGDLPGRKDRDPLYAM